MSERKPNPPLHYTVRVDSYEELDWSDVDILTDEEKQLPLLTPLSAEPGSRPGDGHYTVRVDSYEELDWSDVDILTDEEKQLPLLTPRPA